ETFGVGADQFTAVADVVKSLAFYNRGRTNAFVRPVVDAAGGELVMDGLPEELAVGLAEAHDDAFVSLDFRVPRLGVVGADKDFAVGDNRAAVRFGAKLLEPFHILEFPVFDAPVGRRIFLSGVDGIARNAAAEHRPGVRRDLEGLAGGLLLSRRA